MRIVKPCYYDLFRCRASDCPFTCCRDWKIAVDALTCKKWESLKTPGQVPSPRPFLKDYLSSSDDGSISIGLDKNGLCPFLNEKKLCNVVISYQEDALSHTCHIFPRKKHIFSDHALTEYSLDMGCPEALRLLWNAGGDTVEEQMESPLPSETEEETASLLFKIRHGLLELLGEASTDLFTAWKMIFYLVLDFYDREEELTDAYIDESFSRTFLSRLKKSVSALKTDPLDRFLEDNELFLDLAENYRKEKLYADILEPLAQKAEAFERSCSRKAVLKSTGLFLKNNKAIMEGLRLLMKEEIFSGLLLPGYTLYDMVLKIQWFGMFLAVLRHGLFLAWDLKESLSPDRLMEITTVFVRMTGYNDADIEEYLENSFEEIIWDFGYMSLII